MNTNLKFYTIRIKESEYLYVDIVAESAEEAIEVAQSEYENGAFDSMRRECDGAEFEVADEW